MFESCHSYTDLFLRLQNIKKPHPCSRCHTPVPTSSMTVYESSEDTVELVCARPCVTPEEPSHIKPCYNCFE